MRPSGVRIWFLGTGLLLVLFSALLVSCAKHEEPEEQKVEATLIVTTYADNEISRTWYSASAARKESEISGIIMIVHLETKKAWLWHKDEDYCTEFDFTEAPKILEMIDGAIIGAAEVDDYWKTRIANIKSAFAGEFEVNCSDETYSICGFECRKVTIEVPDVIKSEAYIGYSPMLVDVAPEFRQAKATVVGLFSCGSLLLKYREKLREYGNVIVRQNMELDLPGEEFPVVTSSEPQQIRISREHVSQALFDVPNNLRVIKWQD